MKVCTIPNRVGLNASVPNQASLLADHIASGINLAGQLKGGSFRHLFTPDEVMRETQDFNEVLVVGRPDAVRLYDDYPSTGKIEVEVICKMVGLNNDYNELDIYQRLLACNPGIRGALVST